MLIYPNQHELDRSDSRAAMGLSSRNSPHIILEGSSHTCCNTKVDPTEEMLKEEGSDVPDPVSALPRTLRIWNYDDFCLEQIGEGFFGHVYKVGQRAVQLSLFCLYSCLFL